MTHYGWSLHEQTFQQETDTCWKVLGRIGSFRGLPHQPLKVACGETYNGHCTYLAYMHRQGLSDLNDSDFTRFRSMLWFRVSFSLLASVLMKKVCISTTVWKCSRLICITHFITCWRYVWSIFKWINRDCGQDSFLCEAFMLVCDECTIFLFLTLDKNGWCSVGKGLK